MLQQGIQLLERFAQDDRVRVRKPRENLQIRFTRPVSKENEFIAFRRGSDGVRLHLERPGDFAEEGSSDHRFSPRLQDRPANADVSASINDLVPAIVLSASTSYTSETCAIVLEQFENALSLPLITFWWATRDFAFA